MKKCRNPTCKKEFEPKHSTTQVVCGYRCALEYAVYKATQAQNKDNRKRKREFYHNDKPYQLKKLQALFNSYIRLRDDGNLCISCQKPPKKKNAGHFKSVGAYPELRFNEDNCHLQCEPCNGWQSGNQALYEENLIKKIGLKRVEALKTKVPLKKYTIEEIHELKAIYKEKIKALEVKAA